MGWWWRERGGRGGWNQAGAAGEGGGGGVAEVNNWNQIRGGGSGGGGCLLQPLDCVIRRHMSHVTTGLEHFNQRSCRHAARALKLTR